MQRSNLNKFLYLTFLLAGIGLVAPAAASPLAPITPAIPMPAFTLPGLNGTSSNDTDLRNKVTIIRFWASW